MNYIQVKSWEDFQHYKDRTPPWIKLYNHLLDDFEFSCLPDASKAHLLSIWLLASRTGNKIPNNERWIANKINATDSVDIELLINSGFLEIIPNENNELHKPEQVASKPLHKEEASACLEREGEKKESKVDKDKKKVSQKLDYSSWPSMPSDELFDEWKKLRKRLKANISQVVINRTAKELTKAVGMGFTVDQCFETWIYKGWRGFEADWMNNLAQQPNKQGVNYVGNNFDKPEGWT